MLHNVGWERWARESSPSRVICFIKFEAYISTDLRVCLKGHKPPSYSGTMRALGSEGLQAHGFESCPRSECKLGFLTWGNSFLVGGL
ncbi:hypothetical protein E2C01_057894 [Portunus trituberculatus]|uniref:Uncharacterized protein n=1 Tax=Portunus trituberculatus TaxID=210409 RepID=A0A5B7GU66_PORTR|nr:hypothetical protein [Portunus trituberculatus]